MPLKNGCDTPAAPDIVRGHARTVPPVAVAPRPLRLRERVVLPPLVVVIGASTGGPQALVALIARLAPALDDVPVCIALHMPRDLMSVVAAHIGKQCGVSTLVIEQPMRLQGGCVYLAPGDKHLDFSRKSDGVHVCALAPVPANPCKVSIDALFAAAARIFGRRTLGIVLSGMGEDGLVGAKAIAASGGVLLAQDKATSAVWGMPGAIVRAGIAAATLSPDALGAEVARRLKPIARPPS